MKVVFIGYHCCIRLIKEALALKEKGNIKVHCIGFKDPAMLSAFETYTKCETVDHLRKAIMLHSDADIFHVHNEPNWMVNVVHEMSDKPIVLDVHDSMDYRGSKLTSAAERLAFEIASGFVFVSEPCREISIRLNPILQDKPNTILHSYVNRAFYKTRDWARVGGLVYEGLTSTDESEKYMMYADYRELMNQMDKRGMPFHIYTTKRNAKWKSYYDKLMSHKTLDYSTLLGNLGHHDWGLCGNITKHKNWNVAMPNKLFDYIAGGIPIVAINCKEIETFVVKHDVGISVDSIEELDDRWGERAKYQANVFKHRMEFAMENHIHNIEKLYEEVV